MFDITRGYQLATTCCNSDDLPIFSHREIARCWDAGKHDLIPRLQVPFSSFFGAGTFGRLFVDAYGFVWVFTHNLTVNRVNFVKEME